MQFSSSKVKSYLLGFQVWSAKLQNFHALRIKALLSGTELTMLLNIALKFPRISRPIPVLTTVISKIYFSVQTPKREKPNSKNFSFYENLFLWKMGNGLKLNLLLWIVFLQVRFKKNENLHEILKCFYEEIWKMYLKWSSFALLAACAFVWNILKWRYFRTNS